MKELKAFWHWVHHETPDGRVASSKAFDRLSSAEFCSLLTATRLIEERRQGRPVPTGSHLVEEHIDRYPAALRDLSLALWEALEKMHEQVQVMSYKWEPTPVPVAVKVVLDGYLAKLERGHEPHFGGGGAGPDRRRHPSPGAWRW